MINFSSLIKEPILPQSVVSEKKMNLAPAEDGQEATRENPVQPESSEEAIPEVSAIPGSNGDVMSEIALHAENNGDSVREVPVQAEASQEVIQQIESIWEAMSEISAQPQVRPEVPVAPEVSQVFIQQIPVEPENSSEAMPGILVPADDRREVIEEIAVQSEGNVDEVPEIVVHPEGSDEVMREIPVQADRNDDTAAQVPVQAEGSWEAISEISVQTGVSRDAMPEIFEQPENSWEVMSETSSAERSGEATLESRGPELGGFLLAEKLITKDQLEEALRIQDELETSKPIGQILMDQNLITQKQLNLILERYKKRPRLGEILVSSGAITRENLEFALQQQKQTGLPIGETLQKLGYVTDSVMRQMLCTQLNIPYFDLDRIEVDQSLDKLINRNYAHKYHVIPVGRIGNTVTLAMDDPTDIGLVREIESFTGFSVSVVTSTREAFWRAFARLYEGATEEVTQKEVRLELIEDDEASEEAIRSKYLETQELRKADVLVRRLISIGLDSRATDIHLETDDRGMLARFRIDGVLQQLHLGELQEEINRSRLQVISRVKILGKMDISERRRPQDGSFRVRILRGGKPVNVDFRISTIPGYYGQNAVLRILDPRNAPRSFSELGFSRTITDAFQRLLKRPTGMILVTGPTGSGKSSTLCGALMTVYRPGIKVLTAEDPIEYVYDNFSQCEVNEKIGNTFANYLRAFLRHDPEVIMIGEIRDEETASMSFGASQTGHLVLSTLHTNNAISTVARLLGLKVDSNVLSSCLLGVLSQRLVREICPKCKEEYMPSEDLLREFFVTQPTDMRWHKGRGCSNCNFTGYRGRFAVAELWIPNDEDIVLINKDAAFDELQKSSYKSTILMAEDAMGKLREGRTNLEELIRVLPYSSIYQFRQGYGAPSGRAPVHRMPSDEIGKKQVPPV
jgi:type IV pilus assembly protein PilB